MNDKATVIKFILDRIEDDKAVLMCEGGKIELQKKVMPKGLAIGETIAVTLQKEDLFEAKKEKTAKEILNEIFQRD